MMQFSETSLPLPLHPNNLGLRLDATSSITTSTWPGFPLNSAKSLGTSSSLNSASCMEQLLVHCAHAVDRNDATLAHQIFWVLNTIAPHDGDSTQRLTNSFLRSLISRGAHFLHPVDDPISSLHRFSLLDLASFVDLTPFHRFGFTAANSAILDAVENYPVVHVVDLGTTHCMQLPTLIDSLAGRAEGPPFLKITVPYYPELLTTPPPHLNISYDELGARLVNFARSRNIAMEFRVISSSPSDGFGALIEQLRLERLVSDNNNNNEALVVNCHMLLHYVPDESDTSLPISLRSMFLKNLRILEPNVVTIVDEDVDMCGGDVITRLRSAYNYLWIPYDAVDTFLGKGSEKRRWYEAGLYWKIENLIGKEGEGRVERSERRGKWSGRMKGCRFSSVGFTEEAIGEVKGLLDEHAAGWGLKKEEELELVLTWKGHNVVFASVWVPSL